MNIFSIFKISEIYNKYKTLGFNNGRVFIEVQNGERIKIWTNDGKPATAEEIESILNFAIPHTTRNIKDEFGIK